MSESITSRDDLEQALGRRMRDDEGFRQEVLADPHTAIARLTGITLPQSVAVHIHEETSAALHIVVPGPESDVLTDEQLDSVSGGWSATGWRSVVRKWA